MQKSKFYKLFIVGLGMLGIVFQWHKAFTYTTGPGGGYANAPSESNCTSCHSSYSLTTGSSVISMKINGGSTFKYNMDSTYTISVTGTKSGISKWGFEIVALKDSTNTSIGTWSVSTSDVQTTSATISGKSRSYVEHTSAGTSGSGSRTWSFSWKAPHTNVGNITFYVVVNATNSDGNSSGDQVFANTFSMAPIPLNVPIPGFVISPTTVCEGDSVSFKDTSTRSPISWSWTFSGGKPATSTLQNPKTTFSWGTRKVTLVATNKFGASNSVSKTVVVLQKPTDTIFRSGPLEFCNGDSVTLSADNVGSGWLWSTKDTTQSITVKKSGSYNVVSSNGNCATKSKTVVVNVHTKPTALLSRTQTNDTICTGDSARFSLVTNGVSHSFYNNSKLVSKAASLKLSLGNLTGSTNKIYAIAYDALGCPSDTSNKYKVVVHIRLAAPALSAGTATTQSVTVNWTAITGAKAYEVSTDTGKTWKTPSGSLTHSENGLKSNIKINIMVRAKDVPCSGLASSINLVSLPCSQTTYSLIYDSLICPKSQSNFVFSNISAKHYAVILNGKSLKDTVYHFTPGTDTVIHFAMIDSLKLSCGSFNIDVPISLIKIPKNISISADQPFYCGISPTATLSATGTFDEFDFYMNGLAVQKNNAATYSSSAFKNGDRIVYVGKIKGCYSDSSKPVILHKYDIPVAGFTLVQGPNRKITFTNTSLKEKSRIWYFGDGSTDTAINPVHTYNANNNYIVSLVSTGVGGCKDSIAKTFRFSGIETALVNESIIVMPNPFKNLIIISFYGNKYAVLQVSIADIHGRIEKDLGAVQMVKGNNEIKIDSDDLKSGSYVLTIQDGVQIYTNHIIKY